MTQLREILFDIQSEKILQELFGAEHLNMTPAEKSQKIGLIKPQIDNKVDNLLREFIDNYMRSTPEVKQFKKFKLLYIILNVICTIGIGYTVNEEIWAGLILFAVIIIVTQALPFFEN